MIHTPQNLEKCHSFGFLFLPHLHKPSLTRVTKTGLTTFGRKQWMWMQRGHAQRRAAKTAMEKKNNIILLELKTYKGYNDCPSRQAFISSFFHLSAAVERTWKKGLHMFALKSKKCLQIVPTHSLYLDYNFSCLTGKKWKAVVSQRTLCLTIWLRAETSRSLCWLPVTVSIQEIIHLNKCTTYCHISCFCFCAD